MIQKKKVETVLGKSSTHANVRKVGSNYVYDLVIKSIDAQGNEVVEVLATDRTWTNAKVKLTTAEKNQLDGIIQ